jgi:hypothetical protein
MVECYYVRIRIQRATGGIEERGAMMAPALASVKLFRLGRCVPNRFWSDDRKQELQKRRKVTSNLHNFS